MEPVPATGDVYREVETVSIRTGSLACGVPDPVETGSSVGGATDRRREVTDLRKRTSSDTSRDSICTSESRTAAQHPCRSQSSLHSCNHFLAGCRLCLTPTRG